MLVKSLLSFAILLNLQILAAAFSSQGNAAYSMIRRTSLTMAPRYNPSTERWEASNEDEATPAYGPVGSLIRQGPLPFIQHLTNADEYDQAVLKYMSKEGCDRKEAQGNMASITLF
jgi:hypothetical protein